MIARTLAGFSHTWLTCVGLVLFLTIFLTVLAWVYRRGSANFYRNLAELPLTDQDGDDGHKGGTR